MDAGVIPGKKTGAVLSNTSAEATTEDTFLTLHLRLDGMWCPACAWVVEEVLKKTSGVVEAAVSFFNDTVKLRYLPHEVSPREIISRISRIGYRAYSGEAPEGGPEYERGSAYSSGYLLDSDYEHHDAVLCTLLGFCQ